MTKLKHEGSVHLFSKENSGGFWSGLVAVVIVLVIIGALVG